MATAEQILSEAADARRRQREEIDATIARARRGTHG